MKFKYVIGTLIGVVIVYFIIAVFYGDSEHNHTNVTKPVNNVEDLKGAGNVQELKSKEIIKKADIKSDDTSDEISAFNEMLLIKGFRPTGSRPSIKFDELEKIADSDIEKASKMI